MPVAASFPELLARVRQLAVEGERRLVLIGGCSRSGKTTVAQALHAALSAEGIGCEVVGADCWIVDAARRKQDSRVADRFDGKAFEQALQAVLAGDAVRPPVYDAATRSRLAEAGSRVVRLETGILIAEGVIALLSERLRSLAILRVFVDVPDEIRRQRLVTFCRTTKGLSAAAAAALIDTREREEVPTARASARDADIVVSGDQLPS